MLVPHLHLCNRGGFRDNAAKSGKPGHIGPNCGTVLAKPGYLATMYSVQIEGAFLDINYL